MSQSESELTNAPGPIMERLAELESRIAYLEAETGIRASRRFRSMGKDQAETAGVDPLSGEVLESRFGEFGLAWLGNLVLIFGIIFLAQYLQNIGQKYLASAFGYLSVIGIFGVAWYFRKSSGNLTSVFRLSGYILLYFVTLRLHFFTRDPILTSRFICLVLLLIVSFTQGYIAVREKSQRLAVLAIFMGLVTAIVSHSTHFMLPLATVIAIASIFFLERFGWWRLLLFAIIVVYFINLTWLLSNPFMSHTFTALKAHDNGFIYLFIIAAAFSSIALMRKKESLPDEAVIASIILNGLGFSMLITFFVLVFFKDNYIPIFASIAIFCLVYSIILQSRSPWKVTASLYALYSFVALSVMVYGIYGFPKAYFLLSVQSLLVLAMALWFRSKVIVIMNTFLFIILLMAYLLSSHSVNTANISFALVALITARTLNWQKKRLEIKTEMLRNTFLLIGFFMVLYALYRLVPGKYVTLSWTGAAALYFVLSILIHNVKYRYLALATMASAAIYLFIVDLARVEIVFRIVALMFLAAISFALSLYYTKRLKKRAEG